MEMNDVSSSVPPVNPLMMDEIAEHVLRFLKKNQSSLRNSRLVCRLWDREASKQMINDFHLHTSAAGTSSMFHCGAVEGCFDTTYTTFRKKTKIYSSGLDIGLGLQIHEMTVENSENGLLISHKDMNTTPEMKSNLAKLDNQIEIIQKTEYPEFLSGVNCNSVFRALGQEKGQLFLERFGRYFKYAQFSLCSEDTNEFDFKNLHNTITKWCTKLNKLRIKLNLWNWEKVTREMLRFSQPLWFLQEIEINENGDGRYTAKTQFLSTLMQQSINLRSIICHMVNPLALLISITNIPHIMQNLEKLEICCIDGMEEDDDEYCEFIPKMQFQNLSSLKLFGLWIHMNHDLSDALLQSWSHTVKELKLHCVSDERNIQGQGAFLKVMSFLPNLESLKLCEVFSYRSYHQIFSDILRTNVVHHKLRHLKIEHTGEEGRIPPEEMHLATLKVAFPNLTSLGIFIARETNLEVPHIFINEISSIAKFPKLEVLKLNIDDVSIGENIFGVIGNLQKTRRLKAIRLENTCVSCWKSKAGGDVCAHRQNCSPEGLKEMLVKLRYMDKIQLINFDRFFEEEKAMEKSVQFSKKFENIEFHVLPRVPRRIIHVVGDLNQMFPH